MVTQGCKEDGKVCGDGGICAVENEDGEEYVEEEGDEEDATFVVSGEGVGVEEVDLVGREGFEEAEKGGGGFGEGVFGVRLI